MKVLITRRIHNEAVALLRQAGFELTYFENNEPLDKKFINLNINNFDAILSCVSEIFDKDTLKNHNGRLKILSNMAVGLDNIDLEYCKNHEILVYNTPHPVIESTADLTVTLAFALIRKIRPAQDYIIQGKWHSWDPEIFLGKTFSQLSWGIFGFGNIGHAVAKRLKGFNMKVQYFDPHISEFTDLAEKVSLETLLKTSDIVSLHIPLTKETRHIFNSEKFKMMKSSAYFINMSRGAIVKSDDLLNALKSNTILGAALDVFDPEPVPYDHEILQFNNVLITPHIGTATIDCRREMAICAATNIINNLK